MDSCLYDDYYEPAPEKPALVIADPFRRERADHEADKQDKARRRGATIRQHNRRVRISKTLGIWGIYEEDKPWQIHSGSLTFTNAWDRLWDVSREARGLRWEFSQIGYEMALDAAELAEMY